MKRSVYLFTLFLLVIAIWSVGPTAQEANALIIIKLTSPPDSTKEPTGTPKFKWKVTAPSNEKPKRFLIELARDLDFTSVIWEDTISGSDTSKVYDGAPLTKWQAYYWRMKVEVDSIGDTDTTTKWQEDFTKTSTFFYTTATLFHVPTDLPTIQTGIVWAAAGDTVLVEEGTYYENLRFYKKNLLLTSDCWAGPDSIDTTVINRTIIDGGSLTRGEDNGSVVYFAPGVDSSSTLMGFTLRGGTGTKATVGGDKKTNGGGIFCDVGSSPTIAYNVIADNQATHDGGGIFIYSAAPNILHNIITRNLTVKGSGGAIECYYSIEVKASPSSSPDGQERENEAKGSPEKSGSDAEIKESSSPSKSRLKTSEGEIKNSLNPRDATDVSSATTSHSLAKSAQNHPPVAVFSWSAHHNGIIEREKYLPGDTIIFDGTGSYDPDAGDHITRYQWGYLRHNRCWQDPPTSYSTLSNASVCTLAITETSDKTGLLKVLLLVFDSFTPPSFGVSADTITINIQYPPHADAGAKIGVAPGDTGWLAGSASCDVNPNDVLIYRWTQLSGPVDSVTLENSDSAKAFFVPEDTTYMGVYEFQLMVTDSLDTSFATKEVAVSRSPTAVCQDDSVYADTLVGYHPTDNITLDASLSRDPDSSAGDQIKYYIWKPVARITPGKDKYVESAFPCVLQLDSTKVIQTFNCPFGGLFKFYLRVRDSFGVISQSYDSVLFSVQARPLADAGKDTLLRPGRAYLRARAVEVNPDQRSSITYSWSQLSGPTTVFLQDCVTNQPTDTSRCLYFSASVSGVYSFTLQVDDHHPPDNLSKPDTVVVIANKTPDANVVHVSHAFEGKSVQLDASSSEDPDSAAFEGGGLTFDWSVKSYPTGAEEPVIVNGAQPIAQFVPYGTGTYQFRVWVNDKYSKGQPPDSSDKGNVTFLTVTVDSTYAYPVIQGNLISHNFSASKGGGIDCNGSSPDVFNNIFYKNQSNSSGGAICCRNLDIYASTPQIRKNIFFGNISSDSTGGAIADLKPQLSPSATRGFRKNLAIQCNDFWDNRGGALYQASGNISDNIDDFPRLIDPDFGDFRFECSSPCIGDSICSDIGSLIYFEECDSVKHLKMVSLSLFQNPVATAVAHFIVNTDAPLKAPPVAWVKVRENAQSPVYFTPISSKTFRGSFVFTDSGIAYISVRASSLLERDTTAIDTFSVQLIGAGNAGKLTSFDKKVVVLFPEGSVKEEIYATCICVSKDSRYQFEEQPEVVAFGKAYQLGPSISFDQELTLSFPLGDLDLKDEDKTLFSIYKYEDGKWNQLESFLEGNSVCAEVKSLGVYRLIYDSRGKHIASIPKTYQLHQNYPNPFNPETQIRYDLPASGHVKLIIYNILGQRVKVLQDEVQDAGYKSVIWNGKDDGGQEVASGIYFYKIEAENFKKTKKMVLLK